MKKIYVLFVVVFIVNAASAQKNVIKTSPLGYIYGKYNLQYERMLTDYSSVNVSASYIQPNLFGLQDYISGILTENFDATWKLNGAALSADYRLYTQKESGPKGFYVAPYLRYTKVGSVLRTDANIYLVDDKGVATTIDYLETGMSFLRYGFGVKIGTQWLIADRVSIDWNFGGIGADMYQTNFYEESKAYVNGVLEPTQEIYKIYRWRYAFAMNFTVGYAF